MEHLEFDETDRNGDRPCVRRLRLEHAGNLRDMGGYETSNGGVTAFGRLLRSGGLSKLTADEWKRLTDYGVRTVIDLRSEAEILTQPDQVPQGVAWHHCPLQTGQIDQGNIVDSAAKAFAGSLTEGYQSMVREHGELLAAALKKLIQELERGAVLFHCTAGKDRTGVLASAVYYLCGVAAEDIVADYEVTFTYNRSSLNRLIESMEEETERNMRPFLLSEPESMDRLISCYEEIGLEDYLKSKGLTGEELAKLREIFVKNLSFTH